jgi:DNA-binding SARP family transcriptional activator
MKAHNYETSEAPSSPSFRIWSCGIFRVETLTDTASLTYKPVRTTEWGGSTYPRQLLKALLCCPGRRARREALIDMLWPECDPEQARAKMNTGTTKLRSLLRLTKDRAPLLVTEENASIYSLADQTLLWVDAEEALALLKEVERIGRTVPQALSLLEEAASYFNRGVFLEGEEGAWVYKQRKSIEEARYRCQLWLSEAYERQGQPGQAEMILSLLLAEDPTDEDALRRLLDVLHRQNMLQKGRRIYEETKRLLRNQNLDLSQATITFAEQVLNGRPTSGEG